MSSVATISPTPAVSFSQTISNAYNGSRVQSAFNWAWGYLAAAAAYVAAHPFIAAAVVIVLVGIYYRNEICALVKPYFPACSSETAAPPRPTRKEVLERAVNAAQTEFDRVTALPETDVTKADALGAARTKLDAANTALNSFNNENKDNGKDSKDAKRN